MFPKKLKPETVERHRLERIAADKARCARLLISAKRTLSEAIADGEKQDYVAWLQDKVNKYQQGSI